MAFLPVCRSSDESNRFIGKNGSGDAPFDGVLESAGNGKDILGSGDQDGVGGLDLISEGYDPRGWVICRKFRVEMRERFEVGGDGDIEKIAGLVDKDVDEFMIGGIVAGRADNGEDFFPG